MNDLQLREQGQEITEKAKMAIATQDDYNQASDLLKAIKALLKEADAIYDPSIEAAHASHKAALDLKKRETAPLIEADKALRGTVNRYLTEQDRIRREAEAKAAREREEVARKEREARQAEADALADLLGAEAAPVADAPMVAPPAPAQKIDTNGITMREVWQFEVTDMGQLPLEYLIADESKIRKMVATWKAATNIPGVRVWSEKRASV